MSFLKELANQLSNLWGTWSRTQQVLMVVSAVVCLASIAGVGVWATRPEYIALVDHLGPGDAAEVVSTLEAAGIDYKLNFSGSAISVPRQSVSRARLALKDVIDTESTQDESLDGGHLGRPGTQSCPDPAATGIAPVAVHRPDANGPQRNCAHQPAGTDSLRA